MVVADTGAIVALLDRGDRHHAIVKGRFRRGRRDWVLPWAVLPEVDYLVATLVSHEAAQLFLADVAHGDYHVEWGRAEDLIRAYDLNRQYGDLELGLVDAVVMAVAERLSAQTIATFDRRHFGAVTLQGQPVLWP